MTRTSGSASARWRTDSPIRRPRRRSRPLDVTLPAMLVTMLVTGCASTGGRSADRADASGGTAPDLPANSRAADGPAFPEGPVEGLAFAPDAAQLDADARRSLAVVLESLEAHPEMIVEVQGHTDNRGPAAGNLELSKRRVMAVVRYLVAEGVAPGRLRPFGYGENRPLVSNAVPEGRARNRRIELRAVAVAP